MNIILAFSFAISKHRRVLPDLPNIRLAVPSHAIILHLMVGVLPEREKSKIRALRILV